MQKDNNDKDIGSRIEKWFEELDRFNSDPSCLIANHGPLQNARFLTNRFEIGPSHITNSGLSAEC
jgi:hypothetical protein